MSNSLRTTALLFLLLASAVLLPSAAAAESGYQDQAAIRQAVVDFLQGEAEREHDPADLEIVVGNLDPRLLLTPCELPLETSFGPGARPMGSTTVGVRCPGKSPWTIYVSAEIVVMGGVVVAARYLPRGARLSEQDGTIERQNLAKLPYGFLSDPRELVGKLAQRNISSGAVITPAALAAAPMIKRNERVTLVAHTGGIEVHALGVALEDGAEGARIRVRNSNSQRIVEGVVIAPGIVEINL